MLDRQSCLQGKTFNINSTILARDKNQRYKINFTCSITIWWYTVGSFSIWTPCIVWLSFIITVFSVAVGASPSSLLLSELALLSTPTLLCFSSFSANSSLNLFCINIKFQLAKKLISYLGYIIYYITLYVVKDKYINNTCLCYFYLDWVIL